MNDCIGFYTFFRIFLKQNKIELKLRPFHKEVCDQLERLVLGVTTYEFAVLNICPRVGKTKLMEALCCWQIGHFPESHTIYTSYSSELATASTRYILQTISSEWFIGLFGNVVGSVKQAANFTTKYKGVLRGDGTGGSLTGFGAGLKTPASGFIICDDPCKPSEALSKTVSQATRTWFTNTLYSRRNSPKTPIIICAQRLAEDDLCGYVLNRYKEKVLHLKFPAMIDGVSQIEDTISTEQLKTLEAVDPFTFHSQYQQNPVVLGGNLIKSDWFRYFDDENLKFDYEFFTSDTASKIKERNDFTVFLHWGVLNNRLYLLNMMRGKWEAPLLEKSAIAFYQQHHPRFIKIEMKSSGIGLAQTLKSKGFPIIEIERNTDKYSRCLDAIPFVASGVVYLRKDAEYLNDFLSETMGFRADMGHAHDDICDCLFDAVDHLFGKEASVLDAL